MHLGSFAGPNFYIANTNWLGTERSRLGYSSGAWNVVEDCNAGPYGDNASCTTGSLGNLTPHFYAGYERDSETGLDHMQFRYYNPRIGRFMQADPYGGSADTSDPQSMNRFAYVTNNPNNFYDPLGLNEAPSGDPFGCHGVHWADGENIGVAIWCPYGAGQPGQNSLGGYDSWSAGCMPIYSNAMLVGNTCDSWHSGSPSTGEEATLGLRTTDQTFKQCMAANAQNYSIVGVTDLVFGRNDKESTLGQLLGGNIINALAFGGIEEAGVETAGLGPHITREAMGDVLSHGRNSTEIIALNIARVGGRPMAMSASGGAIRSTLGMASKVLTLGMNLSTRLGIDATLTGAEAIGCLGPR